jgi:hypothetical protein
MNPICSSSKLVVTWPVMTCVLIFIAATLGAVNLSVSPTDSPKPAACQAPEYKQFDFWVGDWDAFDIGRPAIVARLKVDHLLDGCVLREVYKGADGHEGESLSLYDASRKVWHQTWVTNRGELLVIEGGLRNGEMVLTGTDRTTDGQERRVRGIWKLEGTAVRETAVRSMDGGKTWQPWFDLSFEAHK